MSISKLYAGDRPKGIGFPKKYKTKEEHRSARINSQLKCRYGITESDYQKMLFDQHGRCAVCKQENTSLKRLHVDHCHVTGKVRGLLCSNCNTAIGRFEYTGVLPFLLYLGDHYSMIELLTKRRPDWQ